MKRLEIIKVGMLSIQVCAEDSMTDEQILYDTNDLSPSGTTAGWCEINKTEEGMKPVKCAEYPNRTHYIIHC